MSRLNHNRPQFKKAKENFYPAHNYSHGVYLTEKQMASYSKIIKKIKANPYYRLNDWEYSFVDNLNKTAEINRFRKNIQDKESPPEKTLLDVVLKANPVQELSDENKRIDKRLAEIESIWAKQAKERKLRNR